MKKENPEVRNKRNGKNLKRKRPSLLTRNPKRRRMMVVNNNSQQTTTRMNEGYKIYKMLLTSIFFDDKNTLKKVVIYWMKNRIQKKTLVEKPKNFNLQTSDNSTTAATTTLNTNVETQSPPTKKKKKFQMFYVDKKNIKDQEFIHYAFFKGVLQLREVLEIIGTNLYLFNDKRFGIPISKLNGNIHSKIIRYFYSHRNEIFKGRNYTLGQNILKDSIITIKKNRVLNVIIFQILLTFHLFFCFSLKEMISSGETIKLVKSKNIPEAQIDKVHLLTTIRYLEQYSCELNKLLNEEVKPGKLDCDINFSTIILDIFIEDLESAIKKMKLCYDDKVH